MDLHRFPGFSGFVAVVLIIRRWRLTFADNIGRRLVLTQSLIGGMAQPLVFRPFGKGDLGDQFRTDPCDILRFPAFRRIREGAGLAGQLVEPLPQLFQRGFIEAGADSAGILQLPGFVEIAEQERSKSGSRSGGFGESSDHEFLTACALDLQPVPGSSASIVAVGLLAHDALQAVRTGFLEECLAVSPEVIAVADLAVAREYRAGKQCFQLAFAFEQWSVSEVHSIQP